MKDCYLPPRYTQAGKQEGAAAVEFAIVASVFFMLLIGIMEMGRLLWTWNAAAEATRLGARLAVVCSKEDAEKIKGRMREMLPALTANSQIDIEYLNPPATPNSCTADTCKEVRVRLKDYSHQTIIPFVSLAIPLPPFQTTLPREYMNSDGNEICQ
ncbi:TadE family protein [Propionivibrio sp.]|uniref:TadE family protein n=1 Tax=Propionivibrio sp. TaxID=2212460 RepID=UPI00272E2827|nr:TadE/TadG family type IV pilus assembly protein [Propionivibrio sp.]